MKLITLDTLGASETLQQQLETTDSIFLTDELLRRLQNPTVVKLSSTTNSVYGTAIPYNNPSNENDTIVAPHWIYNALQSNDVSVEPYTPPIASCIHLKPYLKTILVEDEELQKSMSHHMVYQDNVLFPLKIDKERIYMKCTYQPEGPCVTIRNSYVNVECLEPKVKIPTFIGKAHKLGGEQSDKPRTAFLEALRKRQEKESETCTK